MKNAKPAPTEKAAPARKPAATAKPAAAAKASVTVKAVAAAKTATPENAAPMKKCAFVLSTATDAKNVCVAGDFSNWTPMPMKKLRGNFQTSVALPPGKYQYRFIIDGQWRPDPACPESAPNGFGEINSVVHVQ